jgi:glycine/D-amino acid oxidase-like deaminating enzyme
LCGSRDDEPLPASSGDVGINNSCINDLIYQASIVSNHLLSNVEKKQACYLPIPDDDNGLPIIGPHPYYKSLYLATGHSVWGILNGPGTGKLISEWIIHGLAKCVKYGKPDL